MPRSFTAAPEARETLELHAPWWSHKRTVDGTSHTPDVAPDADGHYVEHVTVFAQRLAVDDQWIQSKSLPKMDPTRRQNAPIDMSATAKAPVYLCQRMVREFTDEDGHPAPLTLGIGPYPMLSERFLEGVPQRDLNWLVEQLDALKEPNVPVTEADEDESAKRKLLHAQEVAQGVPLHKQTTALEPEEVAEEYFR